MPIEDVLLPLVGEPYDKRVAVAVGTATATNYSRLFKYDSRSWIWSGSSSNAGIAG
jgi:hypothetical protein